MDFVDLHLHSTCSDGAATPEEVIGRAAELSIKAVSLTDHDTVAGNERAQLEASATGIEFISGVEVSTFFQGMEIHVLGYGIDTKNSAFLTLLQENIDARIQRQESILSKLLELGVKLSDMSLEEEGTAPGRMHIALALKEQGYTKLVQEGFDRYLKFGQPAYIPRWNVPIERAIDGIHKAGGLAFLAHPGLNNGVRKKLPALLGHPFDGIEAWHSRHSSSDVEMFCALAEKKGLLVSGGSDCHGGIKGQRPDMGTVKTPMSCYKNLLYKLKSNC